MALPISVENLDEIEEQYRSLYEETDNGYVLSLDNVDEHPNVRNLKNAYEQEKRKRRDASKDRDSFKSKFGRLLEVDPDLDLSDAEEEALEKALSILKGETTQQGEPAKANAVDIDKLKANARKPLEKEIETARSELEKWKSLAQRTLIDNELSKALTRANVKDPDYRELLIERFRNQCRLDEDEGRYSVIMDGEYGEMEPDKWVKEWAQTDYAKKFIGAPENMGGGVNGNRSASRKIPNPWSKEINDFDEQMRIAREDPELARRMAKEAGKPLRF